MSSLSKIFRKAGGLNLLYAYLRTGVFFTALVQFLILGYSKKALEILRLSVQLKMQKKLKQRYKKILRSLPDKDVKEIPHNYSKIIWVCWFQGLENAPALVQQCYESICKYSEDWNISIITSDNYTDYTDIPAYIIDKWQKGIISNTHFSDILRIDLLVRNGGLWIDSTVLCTGRIPDFITHSDLFFYQTLKPGLDGHSIKGSTWLISAKTNNIVLIAVRTLLFNYWVKENKLIDYFLVHHFMSLALERYPEEWNNIPKFSNSIPHVLLLQLFQKFNKEDYNHITTLTSFHKLSYKFDTEKTKYDGTYYDILFNRREYLHDH